MTTKVESGERQRQAMEKIREFEREQRDWDIASLAEAIGISSQQCRTLLAALTVRGELVHGSRTVRKSGLVIASSDSTPHQAA